VAVAVAEAVVVITGLPLVVVLAEVDQAELLLE
jgi:hypothetical protein